SDRHLDQRHAGDADRRAGRDRGAPGGDRELQAPDARRRRARRPAGRGDLAPQVSPRRGPRRVSEEPIRRAARAAHRHLEGARELPVTGPARAADLERHLDAAYGGFAAPIDAAKVIDDVASMLRRGAVHASHPAYFGMFDPSVLPSSVAASTLLAALDPQAASWAHAPAALAMEQHALRFFAARLGYDPPERAAPLPSRGQAGPTR